MDVQLGNFLVENYARAQRTIDKFKTSSDYERDGCKVDTPWALEGNGEFMQRTTWDAAARKQNPQAVELERRRVEKRVSVFLGAVY